MLHKNLVVKNILPSMGYVVTPCKLVNGAWIWYSSKGGSELPHNTMECAINAAWEHASEHTKTIINVSDDHWKALPDYKKLSLVHRHMTVN